MLAGLSGRSGLAAIVAFVVCVAFIPAMFGAATAPRWAVIAVSFYWLDWWCLPFIGWCFYKLDFNSAVQISVLCAAFCWGRRLDDLRPVIAAMSVGLLINGLIALPQYLGWDAIPQMSTPAGLFVNKDVMGDAACLVFALAFINRFGRS